MRKWGNGLEAAFVSTGPSVEYGEIQMPPRLCHQECRRTGGVLSVD